MKNSIVLNVNLVSHNHISVRLSDRSKVTQNKINFVKSCLHWGLNSQPLDHHSNTLPTELHTTDMDFEMIEFSLFTFCWACIEVTSSL